MTFVELLTFRGIRWRPRNKPGEIWMACPICGDVELRLGLNVTKGMGHCFRCDFKSRKAIPILLRQMNALGVTLSDRGFESPEEEEVKIDLPQGFFLLSEVSKSDGGLLYTPRRYLLKRGITSEQIKRHYIGATLEGRMSYRIVIPVHYRKELKGLVCRDYTGTQEPKYLNSSGEKSLYNLQRRKKSETKTLVLSEGCFKALAIERADPTVQSSAILGHAVTDLQIEQMIEARYRSALLFSDPDRAGIKGTAMIAERLADERFDVRVIYPIPHAQADEMSADEINRYLSSSIPWNMATFRKLQQAQERAAS